MRYISTQFSLSTAEHALNYFSGGQAPFAQSTRVVLPPGTYRVINGTLTRIVPGIPKELAVGSDRAPRRTEQL